jgi:cytochrome P450
LRAYGKTICEITQQTIDSWKIGQPLTIRKSMQEISMRVILRVVLGLHEGSSLHRLLLSSLMDCPERPNMSIAPPGGMQMIASPIVNKSA